MRLDRLRAGAHLLPAGSRFSAFSRAFEKPLYSPRRLSCIRASDRVSAADWVNCLVAASMSLSLHSRTVQELRQVYGLRGQPSRPEPAADLHQTRAVARHDGPRACAPDVVHLVRKHRA